jgi:phage baseplate assembly protein W
MDKTRNFLTPSLPLKKGDSMHYDHLDDYADLVKQNFKNLVLTNPGERMMDPLFGVGIQRFLFENADQFLSGDIEASVREQVSVYMPFLVIEEVFAKVSPDSNSMIVNIRYSVPSLALNEVINLSFNEDGTLKS